MLEVTGYKRDPIEQAMAYLSVLHGGLSDNRAKLVLSFGGNLIGYEDTFSSLLLQSIYNTSFPMPNGISCSGSGGIHLYYTKKPVKEYGFTQKQLITIKKYIEIAKIKQSNSKAKNKEIASALGSSIYSVKRINAQLNKDSDMIKVR